MLSLLQKNHFHAPPVLNIFGLAWASCPVGIRAGTITTASGGEGSGGLSDNLIYIVGGVILLGAVILFVIPLLIRKKRNDHKRELEWNQKVGGLGETATVDDLQVDLDRTLDTWEMKMDVFGALTVTASDDPSLPGQRFAITRRRTTLGRKADNDIIFPKDSPVSRHHALVEEKDGGLFLSEVEETDDKTGRPKRPTYGTFINDKEVGAQSLLLQTGDEIRLGKRVKLKFEAGAKSSLGDEKTLETIKT
jgi:hypothetical protein